MNHTPGPWYVRQVTPELRFIVDRGEHQSVAEVMSRWDATEEPANAALIAAAPDLLAALEPFAYLAEVMDEGDVLNFRGVYITYEQAQAARAAIAAATGNKVKERV